jgi:hypothetical protein
MHKTPCERHLLTDWRPWNARVTSQAAPHGNTTGLHQSNERSAPENQKKKKRVVPFSCSSAHAFHGVHWDIFTVKTLGDIQGCCCEPNVRNILQLPWCNEENMKTAVRWYWHYTHEAGVPTVTRYMSIAQLWCNEKLDPCECPTAHSHLTV